MRFWNSFDGGRRGNIDHQTFVKTVISLLKSIEPIWRATTNSADSLS